jgi:Flp pilus assembly protein TadB
MLSHHEDRELRAIEQWFEESDPALTRMLRNYEPPRRTVLRTVLCIAVDVVGVALFVVGAVLALPVLVVIGFLVIVVGVCLHLAAGHRRRQSRRER